MSDSERAQRGNEMRMKLFGVAPEPSENFKDIMDVTVEHLFGDIWTRDGLALRDRSLITVATLIALNREAQLRVHLRGALNVGVGREEIKEMIIHLAHYAGWPAAMTAMKIADEIFQERDGNEGG
jgi:4-carboxymuconolactone decarboxylase